MSKAPTTEELAEWRRLYEAATPGEWVIAYGFVTSNDPYIAASRGPQHDMEVVFSGSCYSDLSVEDQDRDFTIAAHNEIVPRLLDLVERWRPIVEAAEKPAPRLYAAEDAFFRANVKKWLAEGHEGWWAVIKGDEHWIFGDVEVAYRRALATWQSQEFLMRQITPKEEVLVMASRPTTSYWVEWDASVDV